MFVLCISTGVFVCDCVCECVCLCVQQEESGFDECVLTDGVTPPSSLPFSSSPALLSWPNIEVKPPLVSFLQSKDTTQSEEAHSKPTGRAATSFHSFMKWSQENRRRKKKDAFVSSFQSQINEIGSFCMQKGNIFYFIFHPLFFSVTLLKVKKYNSVLKMEF